MAMTKVLEVVVGAGGAASIEFTNIPQTGKNLLVLFSARSTTNVQGVLVRLNSSSSNFNVLRLRTDGSTVSSATNTTGNINDASTENSYTANTFSNLQLFISNYTASTDKSISIDTVTENNSATVAGMGILAAQWGNSSAINALSLTANGTTLAQHSTASLYIIS